MPLHLGSIVKRNEEEQLISAYLSILQVHTVKKLENLFLPTVFNKASLINQLFFNQGLLLSL